MLAAGGLTKRGGSPGNSHLPASAGLSLPSSRNCLRAAAGGRGIDALALSHSLSRATGAPLEVVTAEPGGEDLIQLARSHGADLLVLGASRRGGLGRTVPGATVEHVLGEAPCAVAVAPPGFGQPAPGAIAWRPLDGPTATAMTRGCG